MRIGKNTIEMARAGLGAADAISLRSAVKKFAPGHPGNCPAPLLKALRGMGLVVFVGNPAVAFISEAAAREAIPAQYRTRQDKTDGQEPRDANDLEAVREEVAKARADLLAEIAKLRATVEQLRCDIDALRTAQIAEKTAREQNHDALVGLLAEMQTEVANLRAGAGRNNKPNQQTQEN